MRRARDAGELGVRPGAQGAGQGGAAAALHSSDQESARGWPGLFRQSAERLKLKAHKKRVIAARARVPSAPLNINVLWPIKDGEMLANV
ncbi:unnamed protein product [Colias eurytheme]|nr:unnamed protein product [Colias eurytheme]